jgi:5-formyltetrahydrofolate cyclo-ligase
MQINGISAKKELRKNLRKKRSEFPEETRLAYSRKIADMLFETNAYRSAKTLLVFISTPIEVDTSPIIKKALADGKNVAAPISNSADSTMEFYIFHDEGDLKAGAFGILEPDKNSQQVTEFSDAICIVPGLSFDRRGQRLGFGRGFYDRFLSDFDGVSCGVCFDEFVCDELPVEPTDIPVNLVVTQTEIIRQHRTKTV